MVTSYSAFRQLKSPSESLRRTDLEKGVGFVRNPVSQFKTDCERSGEFLDLVGFSS